MENTLEERVRRLEETVLSLQPKRAGPVQVVERVLTPELEHKLGTYWLSRAGVVALITGVALLIIYRFGELGMWLRIALGYSLSAGLALVGWRISRRFTVFGRVIFGGGLALAYFMTYALHFVPSVKVIDSQVLALVLLSGILVAIVATAHRMQSETVAGIALFLGLHTGMLSDVTAFTLVSTCLLAVGAVFFLVTNRWVIVPLSGLIAVYTTHASWLMSRGEGEGGLGFLAVYFLLFTGAVLLRADRIAPKILTAFTVLNWTGVVALGGYELWETNKLFPFFLALAAVEAVSAVAGRRSNLLRLEHVVLTVVSGALAAYFKLEGAALALTFAAGGVVRACAALKLHSKVLSGVGFGLIASGTALLLFEPNQAPLFFVLAAAFVVARRDALHAAGAEIALAAGLARVLPESLQTVAWAAAAIVLFTLGFALKKRAFRWVGFAGLAFAVVRLAVFDLAKLTRDDRSVTFVVLGLLLLGISFVYTRLRESAEQGQAASSSSSPVSGAAHRPLPTGHAPPQNRRQE
ncbi:MAG: DUF2339 domain-containing protein [Myxococcaceae bacterium]